MVKKTEVRCVTIVEARNLGSIPPQERVDRGHDISSWLNSLGDDNESYPTKHRTNGEVRRSWLQDQSIVRIGL